MRLSLSKDAESVWRRALEISLWSVIGLMVGFFVRYGLSLGQPLISKDKGSVSKLAIPAAPYETKSRSFRAAIEAYRFKRSRTINDRVEMLTTLDLWMSEDPVDCVNTLSDIGALGLVDQESIISVFASLPEGSPGFQMRMASEIRSPDLRDAVTSAVFKNTVASDPEGALELLAVIPPHLKPEMERNLGLVYGKTANPDLFSRLLSHSSGRKELVISGMQEWARLHTSDALSFLDGLDEVSLRRIGTSKRDMLEKLAPTSDPEEILRYAERQPASAVTIRTMTDAIGTLLSENPNRWDELITRQNSDVTIAAIAGNAAAKVVVRSPEMATVYLCRIPGMQARVEATKQTARQFIWQNAGRPEKVIEWARSIPDPIVADRIIAELRFQGAKLPKDFKLR
jgi:hypothetical protein